MRLLDPLETSSRIAQAHPGGTELSEARKCNAEKALPWQRSSLAYLAGMV